VGWLLISTQLIYAQESPAFEKVIDVSPDGKFALRISCSSQPADSNKIDPDLITAADLVRTLYKAHRPWEHKELNLGNRAVLSKYFSPELTKLFLKNAQLERDCPEGELCGLDFDPILGAQDFDDHLNFQLHITEATPPQTGRFEARFKLFNEDKQEQVVVFQLVQLKNGWRIDDIIYPNDNASLKAVITALVNESLHFKE
jgi:hypothetical protein